MRHVGEELAPRLRKLGYLSRHSEFVSEDYIYDVVEWLCAKDLYIGTAPHFVDADQPVVWSCAIKSKRFAKKECDHRFGYEYISYEADRFFDDENLDSALLSAVEHCLCILEKEGVSLQTQTETDTKN